jgi:hypothetical protein
MLRLTRLDLAIYRSVRSHETRCDHDLPIWRFDDFDRGQFQCDFGLTRQERRFELVDFNIDILLNLCVARVCGKVIIQIRVLVVRRVHEVWNLHLRLKRHHSR